MKKAQLIGVSIAGVAGLAAFMMMKGIVNKPAPTKEVQEIGRASCRERV